MVCPLLPKKRCCPDTVPKANQKLKQECGGVGFSMAFNGTNKLARKSVVGFFAQRFRPMAFRGIAVGFRHEVGIIRAHALKRIFNWHIAIIARFKAGDRYEKSEVDDLRRALVATGLVAAVEVTQVPRDEGRTIDLAVKLDPAPMRTIAGEIGYGTGEGFRAEASWQHRNFFNPEGALTVRGVAGTQEHLVAVSLRRNNWRRRDPVLNAQAQASNVDRKAFAAKTLSISGGFERQSNFIWQKKWTWSLGAELIASDERDTIASTGLPRRRTFFIAAIPGSLGYDGSDDLLDPTTGFRILGRLSPELSFQGGTFP